MCIRDSAQGGATPYDSEPDGGTIALLVGQNVLSAVENRHRRRRDLDVVAREERHRGKQTEHANQHHEGDDGRGELEPEQTHLEPPGLSRADGITITESAPSAVTT